MQGLFITSNNTNAGKTFISEKIITALNPYYVIEARKPIETNCQMIDNQLIAKDGIILQQACNNKQSIDIVCPYKFSKFASGEIASKNTQITLQDLINKCISNNFIIIEGAGGFYSPLIKNTLNSDFAKALNLPIIIVIEDKIGAISETLLTINAIKKEGLNIATIILNQKQKNKLDNYSQLKKYTNETIIVFNNNIQQFNKYIIQYC